jgi:hypothetical protein
LGVGDDAERATARELYAATVARVCAAWYQQIRFAEGVELADTALAEIGPRDDAATARLRIARILSHLGATNEARDAVPLLEGALRVARDSSDEQLEYDALDALARVRSETGDSRIEDWLAVADAARKLGDWDGHVGAGLNAATHLVDETPARLPAAVAPLADVAEARGLRETRAWIAQASAEACFLTGAWREALEHADTALDLAGRYGYDRAAVRTWFVVVPIAAVRLDAVRLARAAEWFAARRGELPPSPYGAILQTSVDLWLSAAGLLDPPALPLDRLLPGFELSYDDATFLAATEHVLLELLARGDGNAARGALDRLEGTAGSLRRNWLGTGSALLLRAAVAADGPDAARTHAAEARAYFSRLGAAWWTTRAIRRLAELGSAGPADVEEAEGIEARLLA